MIVAAWPWLALILLGAWHGLNPGMGWLFSVALGLQQRSRRAVFGALLPIAFGHALAGAGLMVVPVLLGGKSVFCGAVPSSANSLLSFHPLIAAIAVGVHTISHLVIAGLVAWIVYDFIGLAVLRRSWINLDLIWCFSLLGAAVILFFAPLA